MNHPLPSGSRSYIPGEGRVSAFVGGNLQAVHPDRRAVIAPPRNGGIDARRQRTQTRRFARTTPRRKGRLPDAGELCLVAERNDDALVERRIVRAKFMWRNVWPAPGKPRIRSSNAKDHSPLRLIQALRRNCGRGYSGRGTFSPTTGDVPHRGRTRRRSRAPAAWPRPRAGASRRRPRCPPPEKGSCRRG